MLIRRRCAEPFSAWTARWRRFTERRRAVGLPIMQTQPGGVAHVRIGEHFLTSMHTVACRVAGILWCCPHWAFCAAACLPARCGCRSGA
ncbi:MAG: hypothetical protein R3A44_34760 [Caldilineaceae bacterium]